MIAAALRGALSDRAREGRVHVVENFGLEKPSTKAALKALAHVSGARVLVVLTRDEDIAWLSLRNVASVHILSYDQLNAYDVLLADDVVFTTAALDAFVSGPALGKSVKAVASSAEILDAPEPVAVAEGRQGAQACEGREGRRARQGSQAGEGRRCGVRGVEVRQGQLRRGEPPGRLRHQGQRGLDEVPHAGVPLVRADDRRGVVQLRGGS